jgi:NAD-dependent dihydropyrimidine dehydrogenase PreA subunit
MTYVITENCVDVKDASCVEVCPVNCIYSSDDDRAYFINPDECIDCGACEPECPVTAIFSEDAVPENQTEWTGLNAQWFEDADAVRARINEMVPVKESA